MEVDPPSAKDAAAGFVPAYSHVVAFTPTVSGAYEVDLIFSSGRSSGEAKISVTFVVEASALDARAPSSPATASAAAACFDRKRSAS